MRLYVDEDAMADALIAALRSRGFDVETAGQLSRRAVADEEYLVHATASARVLYSFNRRDYLRLHSVWLDQGRAHAGIVLLGRRTTDIGIQLRGLISVAEQRGQDGMVSYLEVI